MPIMTTKIARIKFLFSRLLNGAFFSSETEFISSRGLSASTVFFTSGSAYLKEDVN